MPCRGLANSASGTLRIARGASKCESQWDTCSGVDAGCPPVASTQVSVTQHRAEIPVIGRVRLNSANE
jgi:hypothetical protein